ncbi:MAG: endo alpha-1,4 polygalactosaminidase, partial [Planctomycetaceae bacterium]|nr:endo alpha-1,4 polygalactosaminidase [Planctomycetaceae bacterium]
EMQQKMRKGQVVVVELRSLSEEQIAALVKKAHQSGAKIIGYISIGELGQLEKTNFEQFLQQKKISKSVESMLLSKNETFQSWRIDVSETSWREFLKQRIHQIYTQNVDGLFLDTVDTSDLYITRKEWPISRRAKSVEAMISLIRMIKSLSPEKFIMQNRGLNLIGKTVFVGDATGIFIPGLDLAHAHLNNPDGLLWTGAYAHSSAWIASKERDLIQINKRGFTTVFALGYADTPIDRKQFFQRSGAAGFIPAWASSNTKLQEELTQETDAE